MKKLLLILIFASPLQAKQIILDIPDGDLKVVESEVLDAETWIKDAWAGKLAKCKDRMIKKEIDRSVKANEAIPAGETAIIDKVIKDPKFETRKQTEDLKVK